MIFSQRDPAWKNQRLGTVNGTTIGGYGCYVTSFAMVASHFGKNVNPSQLDNIFTDKGLYINGNMCSDNMLESVYSDIKYVGTYSCQSFSCDLNQFLDCNGYGREAIIEIDFDHNSGNGIQTHFVRLKNYDPASGQLIIDDPWYGDEVDFATRYGDARTVIQKIVKYDGPAPVSTLVPAPVVASPVVSVPVTVVPAPVVTPAEPVVVPSADIIVPVSPLPAPVLPIIVIKDTPMQTIKNQLLSKKFLAFLLVIIPLLIAQDWNGAIAITLAYLGVQGAIDHKNAGF